MRLMMTVSVTKAHEWMVKRMTDLIRVCLTKSQCKNVAEFIEIHLIDAIRNDPDIDNVDWIADMIDAMRRLENTEKYETQMLRVYNEHLLSAGIPGLQHEPFGEPMKEEKNDPE